MRRRIAPAIRRAGCEATPKARASARARSEVFRGRPRQTIPEINRTRRFCFRRNPVRDGRPPRRRGAARRHARRRPLRGLREHVEGPDPVLPRALQAERPRPPRGRAGERGVQEPHPPPFLALLAEAMTLRARFKGRKKEDFLAEYRAEASRIRDAILALAKSPVKDGRLKGYFDFVFEKPTGSSSGSATPASRPRTTSPRGESALSSSRGRRASARSRRRACGRARRRRRPARNNRRQGEEFGASINARKEHA